MSGEQCSPSHQLVGVTKSSSSQRQRQRQRQTRNTCLSLSYKTFLSPNVIYLPKVTISLSDLQFAPSRYFYEQCIRADMPLPFDLFPVLRSHGLVCLMPAFAQIKQHCGCLETANSVLILRG